MSGHILVVGSLNMDLVARAPHHPAPGETVLGGEFMTFAGGKGANQAVAAARLGAAVKMVGRVGEDSFADALLEGLRENGVDVSFIVRDAGAPTGVALITVDADGQNAIVVAPGANARLTPTDIDASEELFRGASVLLLQLESPLDSVNRATELARKHSVPIVLNPAPALELSASLISAVDYLIPNEGELALLVGMDLDTPVQTAVERLQANGASRVIVTLGEAGAFVCDGEENIEISGHPAHIVDTTAAGDAFVGAFAVGITEGKSMLEAARFGNAAGAIAVSRAGAQPSLPQREEVEELLEREGLR